MDVTFIIPKIYQAKYLCSKLVVINMAIPYLASYIKKDGHTSRLINGEILTANEFVNELHHI